MKFLPVCSRFDSSARQQNEEHGSALIMAVFVLALLTSLGTALLFVTQNEMKMSRSSVQSKQAFFLAEAGLEDGRLALFAANGGGGFGNDLEDAGGGDNQIDFDPDTVQPVYDGDGMLTGFTGIDDDQPLTASTPFGAADGLQGAYAAFLSNDPTEPPASSVTDLNGRVMITGIGAGPGGSFEMVQAIVEHYNIIPAVPPAAVTILGPSPVYEGGSSGAKSYVGDDCTDPALSVPAVAAVGAAAKSDVIAGLGKTAAYQSGGETGANAIADLTDPTDMAGMSVDSTWTDCMALLDRVEDLRQAADFICADPACVLPALTPSSIVYVEVNYTAPDGQGILVATKTLEVNGGWNWDGPVLVVGTGNMLRDGGGSGNVAGAIVVANIAGPDQTLFTGDDCSEGGDGFGSATFQSNGAGNSTIGYCDAIVQAANPPLPYKVVDFRQR